MKQTSAFLSIIGIVLLVAIISLSLSNSFQNIKNIGGQAVYTRTDVVDALFTEVIKERIAFINQDDDKNIHADLYLPSDTTPKAGIIFTRGGGSGKIQADKWEQYMRRLAHVNYAVLFPIDSRINNNHYKDKGAADIFYAATYLKQTYNLDKIACIGTSQGHISTLAAVEDYSICDAYVNIAGALPHKQEDPYLLRPNQIAQIESPSLFIVGDEDPQKENFQLLIIDQMDQYAPDIAKHQEIYQGPHGFMTLEGQDYTQEEFNQADKAQKDIIAFLKWQLEEAKKPDYYTPN